MQFVLRGCFRAQDVYDVWTRCHPTDDLSNACFVAVGVGSHPEAVHWTFHETHKLLPRFTLHRMFEKEMSSSVQLRPVCITICLLCRGQLHNEGCG